MVPPHRRALRARLLLLRYIDGIDSRLALPTTFWGEGDKVMAGGTPANPAALEDLFLAPKGAWGHRAPGGAVPPEVSVV
jgi:hypothetical protein